MSTAHFEHWPPGLSRHLSVPQTNLYYNLEVSAARFPDKPFLIYYDSPISYRDFKAQAERIAGYLQHECAVRAGDRVLLCMQNSPQWAAAFYGILRANAIVVPVNPMNTTEELRHYVNDADASVAFVSQELLDQMAPLLDRTGEDGSGLQSLIVATYSDMLLQSGDAAPPPFVAAPRKPLSGKGIVAWVDAVGAGRAPGPLTMGPDDLCVMPYTSGTTGHPKGCMHTHSSVMCTAVGGIQWFSRTQDSVSLSVLPFFHVTGMSGGLHGPVYAGATIVLMSRWDRDMAAAAIEKYRITTWQSISTMMIDFLANPKIDQYDISSLTGCRGGGAAMPEAVARKLKALTGLDYVEGYGMSETMAATHINPGHRPKPQCLGIPVFDVDARLIDPATLEEVAQGETGEIIVHAPQIMQGYWGNPEATRESFLEIDGKRFLRTGDLARVDEDGYYFMTDRLKRMINAAGFKVWPAEVESMMHAHPAIREVCVIAARDPRRGETVKAMVVLQAAHVGKVTESEIMEWSHSQMAAYKSPRIVEFVDALPKSGSGKVMWRELQRQQDERDAAA